MGVYLHLGDGAPERDGRGMEWDQYPFVSGGADGC